MGVDYCASCHLEFNDRDDDRRTPEQCRRWGQRVATMPLPHQPQRPALSPVARRDTATDWVLVARFTTRLHRVCSGGNPLQQEEAKMDTRAYGQTTLIHRAE